MDCASCVAHVEKAARKVGGVRGVRGEPGPRAGGRAVRSDADGRRTSSPPRSPTPAIPRMRKSTPAPTPRSSASPSTRPTRESWFRRAVVGVAAVAAGRSCCTGRWCSRRGDRMPAHRHCWMNWLALATSTIAIVYVGWAFLSQRVAGAAPRARATWTRSSRWARRVAYGYSLVAFVGYLAGWWRTLPDLYFMDDRPARADQPRPLARSRRRDVGRAARSASC